MFPRAVTCDHDLKFGRSIARDTAHRIGPNININVRSLGNTTCSTTGHCLPWHVLQLVFDLTNSLQKKIPEDDRLNHDDSYDYIVPEGHVLSHER